MLLFVVGEPVPWTNGVHVARLQPDRADARISEAVSAFRRHGVPAMWWLGPSSLPADLGRRLLAHGFRPGPTLPWLGRNIDGFPHAGLPDGVEGRRVDSRQLQAAWLEAMRLGFGMDPAVTVAIARLADAVGWEEDAPWQRFVALERGRPVGSSGLMLSERMAGIYNVATVPALRRRGVASAMTSLAIGRAGELGYATAVLAAEGVAIHVYEGLGFHPICEIRSFVLDAAPGKPVSSR
jgi:ribosomal protein S18 acetylase RimI-like enzyme